MVIKFYVYSHIVAPGGAGFGLGLGLLLDSSSLIENRIPISLTLSVGGVVTIGDNGVGRISGTTFMGDVTFSGGEGRGLLIPVTGTVEDRTH